MVGGGAWEAQSSAAGDTRQKRWGGTPLRTTPCLAVRPWAGPPAPGPVGHCSPGSGSRQEALQLPQPCTRGPREPQRGDTVEADGGHRRAVRAEAAGTRAGSEVQGLLVPQQPGTGWAVGAVGGREHAGGVAGAQLGTADGWAPRSRESVTPTPRARLGAGLWPGLRLPEGPAAAGADLTPRGVPRHCRLWASRQRLASSRGLRWHRCMWVGVAGRRAFCGEQSSHSWV